MSYMSCLLFKTLFHNLRHSNFTFCHIMQSWFPVFFCCIQKSSVCHCMQVICWVKLIWAATWQNQQNNVCPAKTRISLGIHSVWSESSLSAWRNLGSLATHWVHSKDYAQADLSLQWAHRSFCCYWLSFFHVAAQFLDSVTESCLVNTFE